MLLLSTGWDIGPQNVNVADVLANHAQYNATAFKTYLQPDIKWIVPVREPVSWLKSAVKYFKLIAKKNVSEQYLSSSLGHPYLWVFKMSQHTTVTIDME